MDNLVGSFKRPILDDRFGSPSNSFHCPNCDALFDMGGHYPVDTFCCSHCYFQNIGEPCPESHQCRECRDNLV